MLHFFRSKERLRLLLLVAAVVAPGLVAAALLVAWLGSESAKSEPNVKGGLHYRAESASGITTFPDPLAAVIRPHPESVVIDLGADTDATGHLLSAAITGHTGEDLGKVSAYYAGPGRIQPKGGQPRYSVSIVDLGERDGGRRNFRIGVTRL